MVVPRLSFRVTAMSTVYTVIPDDVLSSEKFEKFNSSPHGLSTTSKLSID